MAEASEILAVTVEAVRGRIKRGTLEHERDSGTVYVLADELRDRIRYRERQAEEEREARRRADTLLAQLMQRIPELEAPQEATGAPESAASTGPNTEASPERETAAERPHAQEEPDERLSWWRRWFG